MRWTFFQWHEVCNAFLFGMSMTLLVIGWHVHDIQFVVYVVRSHDCASHLPFGSSPLSASDIIHMSVRASDASMRSLRGQWSGSAWRSLVVSYVWWRRSSSGVRHDDPWNLDTLRRWRGLILRITFACVQKSVRAVRAVWSWRQIAAKA